MPCRFAVLSQMNKHVHGKRLAQAHEILAEFIDPHSEGTTCLTPLTELLTVLRCSLASWPVGLFACLMPIAAPVLKTSRMLGHLCY